ncbi:MAG: MBL fold metallo-hydrolase [Firmicutes bacterium]|nr:MBL fold metallo-hydrolase [Bacillota bacterium]
MKYDLQTIAVGPLMENCYILTIDNNTYLIDPGDEEKKIEKYLHNKKITAILVTHHHFDHVGALEYFEKKYNLEHNNYNDDNFEIIKNPGHSSDSISFYFKNLNIMFCGDFIFKNSIGRMDLPTGNENEMKKSLEMISNYDDNIVLYPGHGDKTTLGKEKNNFKYYF